MAGFVIIKLIYVDLTSKYSWKNNSKESTKIVNFNGVHYLDSPMLIFKMILELQDRRPLFIDCQYSNKKQWSSIFWDQNHFRNEHRTV